MNAFVVSGLIKRRTELAGEIKRMHEALRKMVLDLETILQFEPDFRVGIKPKAFRPPKDWSNRGQMTRLVDSMYRSRAQSITSMESLLVCAT